MDSGAPAAAADDSSGGAPNPQPPPPQAPPPDFSPFAPLLGVLSARFGHDSGELGGAVTAALAHAALSTRGRMAELAERARALHRDAVLCKRALADQRKHEAERLEAALRDQERQILRRGARPPSLIEKFVATKFGDYFQVWWWRRRRRWIGVMGWDGGSGLWGCMLVGVLQRRRCVLQATRATVQRALGRLCKTSHHHHHHHPHRITTATRASATTRSCRACCARPRRSTTAACPSARRSGSSTRCGRPRTRTRRRRASRCGAPRLFGWGGGG